MQGWKDLVKELGVPSEVVDLTHVPAEECIARDAKRDKRVGYTVIANMALRSGLKTFDPGKVVLCDIDGTVADIHHRLHYVKREPKDWKGFFSAIPSDTPRLDVAAILEQHHQAGRTIIFLSARPDTYKEATLHWLATHGGEHFTVIMRDASDHRQDEEAKRDMLKRHFPDLSVIYEVIDDRPRVIRMWRALGLRVTDVGPGVEF
jgi:hypothetical protein